MPTEKGFCHVLEHLTVNASFICYLELILKKKTGEGGKTSHCYLSYKDRCLDTDFHLHLYERSAGSFPSYVV